VPSESEDTLPAEQRDLLAGTAPKFKIETRRRALAIERLRIVQPVVIWLLDWTLFRTLTRLAPAFRREAQREGPSTTGCPRTRLAELDASCSILSDAPVVAAISGGRLAHGKEGLTDKRGVYLALNPGAVSFTARAAHMHLVN